MEAAGGVVLFFSISYFYVDFLREVIVAIGEEWVQKEVSLTSLWKSQFSSCRFLLPRTLVLMLKININTTKVNCACFLFVFPREMSVQMF